MFHVCKGKKSIGAFYIDLFIITKKDRREIFLYLSFQHGLCLTPHTQLYVIAFAITWRQTWIMRGKSHLFPPNPDVSVTFKLPPAPSEMMESKPARCSMIFILQLVNINIDLV